MKFLFKASILFAINLALMPLQAMSLSRMKAAVAQKIHHALPEQNKLIKSSMALATAGALYYGYRNWFAVPDKTMPTLETLHAVTFLPINPSDDERNRAITNKEDVIKLLKKPYAGEVLAMFMPFLRNSTTIDEIISINGQFYKVQSGIPDEIKNHQYVTIRSGGCYDPKLYSAYVGIKAGSTHGACIAFSYPTSTRRAFNYCQEQDVECINLIYDEIVRKNPHAQISLYGTCKGGTNLLCFLADKTESGKDLSNAKSIALESPTISVQKALSQYPIYPFVGLIFPNHQANGKTILDAKKMPAHIPIFIGRLNGDTVSKFNDTDKLVHHLNQVGSKKQTYLLTTQESSIRHGLLGKAQDYQKALNVFYKINDLPYHPNITQDAEELLKKASTEASKA